MKRETTAVITLVLALTLAGCLMVFSARGFDAGAGELRTQVYALCIGLVVMMVAAAPRRGSWGRLMGRGRAPARRRNGELERVVRRGRIEGVLRESGIKEIVAHNQQFPFEFCEDCGRRTARISGGACVNMASHPKPQWCAPCGQRTRHHPETRRCLRPGHRHAA